MAVATAFMMLIAGFSIGCSDATQKEEPDSPGISIEAGGKSDGARIDINTPGLNLNIDASKDGVSISGEKGDSGSSEAGGIDVNVDGKEN